MDPFSTINTQMPEMDMAATLLNFLFCVFAPFLLRSIYIRNSISVAGKFHIGIVIPILATVTFLVIVVVKSSLALSLGLVGALSIVRFRTPIKEPEELVYLFLTIALGLGYGAGQTIITSVVFCAIILIIIVFLFRKTIRFEDEFNLIIEWSNMDFKVEKAMNIISPFTESMELAKYGKRNGQHTAFLRLNLKQDADIDELGAQLQSCCEGLSYSLYEARPLQ